MNNELQELGPQDDRVKSCAGRARHRQSGIGCGFACVRGIPISIWSNIVIYLTCANSPYIGARHNGLYPSPQFNQTCPVSHIILPECPKKTPSSRYARFEQDPQFSTPPPRLPYLSQRPRLPQVHDEGDPHRSHHPSSSSNSLLPLAAMDTRFWIA